MSSSSGAEQTLTSPTEQQSNATEATTMDAKLMVATASGDIQQLKDLVKKQESQMMVVVMAKQAAAKNKKHHQGSMHPHLLALASSGSCEELRTLLNGEDSQASGNGSLPTGRAWSYGDTEANESILAGKTAEGDTALHVVAACGEGDSFLTRRWRWWLTCAERHVTYGDGDNFLESARIIHKKDKKLLFAENSKGDTPLHCAARAGKSKMVACLIDLALADERGEDNMMDLLRKQNKDKETALHQAVRVGNNNIVSLLMNMDRELASFPAEDGGASPMYLAYVLQRELTAKTLYAKSNGKLSISGQNGQNLLHAAVLRRRDLTELLEWNKMHLCAENKDLTTQRDENGSTPLHFAASIKIRFGPSRVCWQVLEANPEALYHPDHAGFFPIHVAASVGAIGNVNMFVKKCPGSAGLRDAKGRTFLHVAVENEKANLIRNACRNLSLAWIMNMVDNDGNTALHLAVEAGRVRMFCPLVGNLQVNLNLPNNREETPLDIAEYKFHGFHYNQSSESLIHSTLRIAGAVKGVGRHDPLENNKAATVKHDEIKAEVLKDSTGTLCIGSVLIATVTFGATFAVPGGYIADDHSNGGSPVLARRYVFDAFIASNTLAFIFSAMSTIGLMYSGSPFLNLRHRQMHLALAGYLLSISMKSLASAFALGAYVVLAPVSHMTAVATCVLTCLVLLYTHLWFIWRHLLLLRPLSKRKGLIWASVYSAMFIVGDILLENWPLIFIFGWAAHSNPAHIQE